MCYSPLARFGAALVIVWLSLAGLLAAADFPEVSQLKPSTELPDPLVMLDGTKVTNKADWEAKRKPELKALFQHYMYGRMPPKPARQEFRVSEPRDCLGGKAVLRDVTIVPIEPRTVHPIHVVLITPKEAKSPPVFIGMNFCGNHALLDDPKIPLPSVWVRSSCDGAANERATDAGRGSQKDTWNADLIVSRGYALASFYSADVDPDTPDMTDGIGPAFYKPGQTQQGDDDAGTIALWAWGFQRVVDYLVDSPQLVDPKRIAIVGHSRNGKTALLAGAMDERIALVIPHQAGCGGTAPSRTTDPKAESVQRINTSFPHWFCGNFKKYNDRENELPVDAHMLIALIAPRPVYVASASEDLWADPRGEFLACYHASPVYELLGKEGLKTTEMPKNDEPVHTAVGYHIRTGKHDVTDYDWEQYLKFADKHFRR
jgi:(4-O-methyl)-D-glucuronate---lignin esterase